MKFKHNKKRNTAFLYETMIKELTKAVVNKDDKRKKFIVDTMKQYFNSNTPLGKELRIYRDLNETSGTDLYTAERLLMECKKEFHSMDRKEIFNLQTELISESISEHQQRLLNKYILSFSDNGLELKAYLNEEVVRLKEEVSTLIANEDLTTDSDVRDKMKQVHAMLESFRLNKLDQNLITKILKIQNLIREANE